MKLLSSIRGPVLRFNVPGHDPRSDNFNFARYGMPAPCFSMGMKKWDAQIERTYHRRDDNVDNMDLDYVVKFIRAYILSAQNIANDPVQPHWAAKDEYEKAWLNLYVPAHLNAPPAARGSSGSCAPLTGYNIFPDCVNTCIQ